MRGQILAHVVRKQRRRVAGGSIRWCTQRSSNRNIHNQEKRISRTTERPCVSSRQVGGRHHKIRRCGIVNVVLNHICRPDLAVGVKSRIDLLAGREGEAMPFPAASGDLGMNGRAIASRAWAVNGRTLRPVLHNVRFPYRRPRNPCLRPEVPERRPQSNLRWNLQAGFNPPRMEALSSRGIQAR